MTIDKYLSLISKILSGYFQALGDNRLMSMEATVALSYTCSCINILPFLFIYTQSFTKAVIEVILNEGGGWGGGGG